MTPVTEGRTATISLTPKEEEVIRQLNNKAETEVLSILWKLLVSIRTQDTLLGPVGHTKVELLDF